MQAQPYRKQPSRAASPVVTAMRRGRAAGQRHPMDARRMAARRRRKFVRALTKR